MPDEPFLREKARQEPPAILAVDEELDFLATYYRLLTRGGYRVFTAASRMTGLVAVERERPQLVIADLYLPDGDVLDVIRAARMLAPPAPVIVVTRFSGESYRQSAQAAGASGFLSKPFESAALLDLVRSHLPIPPPTGGLH
jgi:DNA-binding response OmpR family regulator